VAAKAGSPKISATQVLGDGDDARSNGGPACNGAAATGYQGRSAPQPFATRDVRTPVTAARSRNTLAA
jgi:hypothetical protein